MVYSHSYSILSNESPTSIILNSDIEAYPNTTQAQSISVATFPIDEEDIFKRALETMQKLMLNEEQHYRPFVTLCFAQTLDGSM
jgi:hypothetical protein